MEGHKHSKVNLGPRRKREKKRESERKRVSERARERKRFSVKKEKLVVTYQLYFLCRVKGCWAFVCLFVWYTKRMDAISLAIQTGLHCGVVEVIFHVRN